MLADRQEIDPQDLIVIERSLQTILSKAQPGTLFAKVQSNVTRKLANNAAELAATAETLRSFVGQKAITR